ncbi:MAG: U32 family peptidase [Gammaproteobacteria bacterium]|nr:U32 family peptidase [Gammaproteobacteria bacterium]
MKISLAAVPYFWSQDDYIAFYQKIASSPVDIVYLGETVCSKRRTMKFQDWLEIAELLTRAGKQVVLSTLTLLEADSELKYLSKIAKQKEYLIEANDMAAIQVAAEHGNAYVAGTAINVYNNRALDILKKQGMSRWCVPVELGQQDIAAMASHCQSLGIELEYQVFGRMPLAYSARCFTARHHQLPKDDCQLKCLDYEQGLKVKTQEGDSFAQINGIETQSAKITYLFDRWQEIQLAGVDILRIVPVSARDTLIAVDQLAAMISGSDKVANLTGEYEYCNGYWLGVEGMKYIPLQ